jgi:hypothetical protein
MPRDIFANVEAIDPGALPAVYEYFVSIASGGIGLDLDLFNNNAVAGIATVTIDGTVVATLAPGQAFALDNVLFSRVRVQRAGAAAIGVNMALAGVSHELIGILMEGRFYGR